MVRTTVLNKTHFVIPPEDRTKSPEFHDFKLQEQECVSLLKKCKSVAELKQCHGQILKLGLFSLSSFCSSNLVTTCALSDWGSMDYACSIFEQVEDPNCSFLFNAMIRGHVNHMNLEESIFLYDQMLEMGVEPDNFTYPILLKACARLWKLEEGMQIHGHIFKLGLQDDVFVQNSLINMYGKCGNLMGSCSVFKQMDSKSVASWSALIAVHASKGMWSECLSIFGDLTCEKCWKAEESILVNVLSSCTHLGDLELGRCAHGFSIRNLSGSNIILETSLIDMYVKCGYLERGLCLFGRMRERNQLSYSVMISGLAAHGSGIEALKVFSEMLDEGFEPDEAIYVGVLKACSHAGMVEEGLQFFNNMKLEHSIEPTIQHYGCLVDLLGQAGMVKEAFELVKTMPMEANDVLWRSLLTACRIHRNLELGVVAARNLLELNLCNASDYLVLSNIYAQAQRWENVATTRTDMVGKGLVQTLGFCSVEVKRKVYKFVSFDMSQPHCKGVDDMLHQMEWQLKFEGYSPDTSQVLQDINEEEKRERLSKHCQKLAIGFALIHTPQGSPIRIVRNLRMCKDCHTYTKLISYIYERRISVKDRNRFHHFQDGTCSCRDYW